MNVLSLIRHAAVPGKPGQSRVGFTIEHLEGRNLLTATPIEPFEFLVNTVTTNDQGGASIAVAENGSFVVTWTATNPGEDGRGIYAQRYDASGLAQGGEFRVDSYTTDDQAFSAVSIDADGDFVVTWTSVGQDGSGAGIYAKRFNSAGDAQGSEFRVNTYATDDQRESSVSMDASGNFVITWHGRGVGSTDDDVYARRYNSAGIAQGGQFRVNSYSTSSQRNAAVSLDASGDFVVVWTSAGQDGNGYGVYAQRYGATGNAVGGEFRVNSQTIGDQRFASISSDAEGDFVVAWQSSNQDGSGAGIFAQLFNASGIVQGNELQVNDYTANDQSFASVSLDEDGGIVVTWSSFGQDGSDYGVYARSFRADGTPQGGEFLVNVFTTGVQIYPAVSMDADGNFAIAWSSYAQDGNGYGIFAQRYSMQNEPPVANAGGPYFILEGESLVLDATNSFDPDLDALVSFTWDLNGDGIFTDAIGVTPTITWSELVMLGLQDGNTMTAIRVKVEDANGVFVTSDPATVTILNAPPSVAIVGPSNGVRGQPRTYTLNATDLSPADEGAGFTFEIDWDGNGTFEQVTNGLSGTQLTHVFTDTGLYDMRVRATDKDGGVSEVAALPVTITAWGLQTDDANPGLTNLVWGGTTGIDAFGFVPGLVFTQALNNQFFGTPQLTFMPSYNGKLYIYGQSAGDLIFADVMATAIFVDGGAGDDVIIGGRGNDTLVGGMGNDVLFGGTLNTDGNDLILGGEGDDFIVGHWGSDTLQGGVGTDLLLVGALHFTDLPSATYGASGKVC